MGSDVVHQSSDDTMSALDESIQNIYKLKEQSKQVNKLLALLEDPSEESTENPTVVDQTTTDESMKKVQQPDTASPAEAEEMTAAPVGEQHQEEHAGEDEEKEDNSPGFHIKLHIKLTEDSDEDSDEDVDVF